MRERIDVGTGLVALGSVLLFVSLFLDWFDRSGDAWAVFELTDIVLAGCAIAGVVAILPRYTGLARAIPLIAFGALAVVAVQLIDHPPAARGDRVEAGAWIALAATALMAVGATMSAASISVTVDVRGRERRRRSAAIDAREAREARESAAASAADGDEAQPAAAEARWARRRATATAPASAPPEPAAADEPRRPRRGAEPAPETGPPRPPDESRRSRRLLESDADAPPPVSEPAPDPDRTQALDPVDPPKADP